MNSRTQNQPTRRRRGRPPKSEGRDTKAELIDAALTLFAQNGYAGTSIRALAREVGLSESVLYAHFENKQAIFDAALRKMGPLMAGDIISDAAKAVSSEDAAEFIRVVAKTAMEQWDTPRARQWTSLLGREGMFLNAGVLAGVELMLERVSTFFERWQTQGRIRDGVGSPEDLAFALFSPLAQIRFLYLHSEAPPETRQRGHDRALRHAEHFVAAVLK